jgi:plastocyanin
LKAVSWIIAVAAIVIAGTLVMGIAIAIFISGGSGGSEQTPVTVTGSRVTIDIRDFDYFPRDLTINAGTTVTWTNYDDAPHTATEQDEEWDTERLDKDEGASLAFDSIGRFEYYCVYHPYMEATLTVQ